MTNETNSKENHAESKSPLSVMGSDSAYDKWNEIIQLPSIGPIKGLQRILFRVVASYQNSH